MILFKWFAIMKSSSGKVWVSNPFDTEEEAWDFGINHKSRLVTVQQAAFSVSNKKLEEPLQDD